MPNSAERSRNDTSETPNAFDHRLIKMKYPGGQFSDWRTDSTTCVNGTRADTTVSASSCQKLCVPIEYSRIPTPTKRIASRISRIWALKFNKCKIRQVSLLSRLSREI